MLTFTIFLNEHGCHPCLPVGKADARGNLVNINEELNLESGELRVEN